MAGTATLRKAERELIALIVSLANDCHWSTTNADVDALREAGFSDRDILEVVGYYAYANRIADGLGLQTEHWIPD